MVPTQTQDSSTLLGTRFRDMPAGRKISFIVRLVVALCTFGFVYPNIMTE